MSYIFVGAKDDYYDATDSWHGYAYQGKVSFFVALKILNKLYLESKVDEIGKYFLEIEWLEDFSILYSKDAVPEYISIHQVKARINNNVEDYSDSLESLARKLFKNPNIECAYLHTETELDLKSKPWLDSVRDTVHSCNSAVSMLRITKQHITDTARQDLLLEQYEQGRQGRRTKYAGSLLTHYREKHGVPHKLINKATLVPALKEFEEELEQCVDDFKRVIDDSVFTKISCYDYLLDGHYKGYCPAKDINTLLESEINEYYNISNSLPEVKGDTKFGERAIKFLLAFLDQHILARHTGSSEKRICLSIIDGLLHERSMIERSSEFYLYNLKSDFYELATKNCQLCKASNPVVECNHCNVPLAVEKIRNYSNEQFEHFLSMTFPHINGKPTEESGYKKYLRHDNGYETPFFEMLEKNSHIFLSEKIPLSFVIQTNQKKELHLLSTLRCSRRPEQELEWFCRNIIENTDVVEILYEYNSIVCQGFSPTTLSRGAGSFWEIIKTEMEEQYREHIYYLKDIQIIPVDNY